MRYLIAIILLAAGTSDLSWSANCLLDSADTEVLATVGPFPAGTEIVLYREGAVIDQGTSADDGLFVSVADVLTPGETANYSITVDGEDAWTFDALGREDCAEVQPTPAPEVAPPPLTELPFTGLATDALLSGAALLLLAGGGLVVVSRRK